MTGQEILKTLKEKSRLNLQKAVTNFMKFDTNMLQVTTDDGDNLSIDAGDVELGASVYTLDDNGNNTPADDGEYTLSDGRIITVTDGKISNIGGTAPGTDTDNSTSPETEMTKEKLADAAPAPTDAPATSTDNSDLEGRVANLEAQVAQIIEALTASNSTSEQMNKTNEQLLKRVEALSKEPAAPAIQTKKVEFTTNKSELELINQYSKFFRA